jgi:hypothetical protein
MFAHPLSDYKFLKLSNKIPLIGDSLIWEFGSKKEEGFSFLPNIVCFPMNDFKLTVVLSEIGVGQNKSKSQVYVNLGKKKNSKNMRYYATS